MTTLTTEEIIEMTRQAGGFDATPAFLERFAKLIVQHERDRIIAANELVIERVNEHIKHLRYAVQAEREACAKVCETAREAIWEYHEEHLKAAACNVCTNIAQAIRARGEST